MKQVKENRVEAPDYKHYVLPLLFYKRLSDVYGKGYEEELKKWSRI